MTRLVIDENNSLDHQGGFLGGFYARPMNYPAGQVHPGHMHYIDHLGELISGHVLIEWVDEDGTTGEIEVKVPALVHIPARRRHTIRFLADSQWRCLFAAAEADRVYGTGSKVPYYFEALNG